jgi:hypothetical protein
MNSPVINYMVSGNTLPTTCNQTKVTVSLPLHDLTAVENGKPNTDSVSDKQ